MVNISREMVTNRVDRLCNPRQRLSTEGGTNPGRDLGRFIMKCPNDAKSLLHVSGIWSRLSPSAVREFNF